MQNREKIISEKITREHVNASSQVGGDEQKEASSKASSAISAPSEVLKNNVPEGSLEKDLSNLAELIANVTESYTVSIFLADDKNKTLAPCGHHTLSRDYVADATIPYGSGLVGWTAENKVRISVCPFENDSTTLLYYDKDQALKSFIAVPMLLDEHIIGVISCDSKKSYAFAKITEKILSDCAVQATSIVRLHKQIKTSKITERVPDQDLLQSFVEHTQGIKEEDKLLHTIARLPMGLVKRNALVVMTCDTPGSSSSAGSPGMFYAAEHESKVGHRLLEMIYRHKRVLCSERSVHALPFDDESKRSFLSVPFHCLGIEAGSINLLSFPNSAFSAAEIETLENVALSVGRELERIRLLEQVSTIKQSDHSFSWRNFVLRSRKALEISRQTRAHVSLTRISVYNFSLLERTLGFEEAQGSVERTFRLLEQIVRPPSLLCRTVGLHAFVLADSQETEKIIHRLRKLLEKQSANDKKALAPSCNKLILDSLKFTSSVAFADSDNIEGLIARTRANAPDNVAMIEDRKIA